MKKKEKGKVVVFRLWPPYSALLEEKAKAARMKVNDYARVATMSAADAGLLDLTERMKRFEAELIRLRKDVRVTAPDEGGPC